VRFYLNQRNGTWVADNRGAYFETQDDAQICARGMASELGREPSAELDGKYVVVTDEVGTEVYRTPPDIRAQKEPRRSGALRIRS
jgi:hypothetical protein